MKLLMRRKDEGFLGIEYLEYNERNSFKSYLR